MGWGMDFGVLLFDNDAEVQLAEYMKNSAFKTENTSRELIIRMPQTFLNSEDLLSTLDFKNHILETREGITVPNSVYIKEKEVPRNFILSKFLSNVKEGKINVSEFDEETIENFKLVTHLFEGLK